jgi:hypothetical protein
MRVNSFQPQLYDNEKKNGDANADTAIFIVDHQVHRK